MCILSNLSFGKWVDSDKLIFLTWMNWLIIPTYYLHFAFCMFFIYICVTSSLILFSNSCKNFLFLILICSKILSHLFVSSWMFCFLDELFKCQQFSYSVLMVPIWLHLFETSCFQGAEPCCFQVFWLCSCEFIAVGRMKLTYARITLDFAL